MHYKRILACFNRMVAVAAMVAAAGMFTSCSDDDEPDSPVIETSEHGVLWFAKATMGHRMLH